MIDLDDTLQTAQDGQTHHPIIEILSSQAVSEIPFDGQMLTQETSNEQNVQQINHSSGRLILVYDFNTNLHYVYTDTSRTQFYHVTFDTSGTMENMSVCELSDGNICITYAYSAGGSYYARYKIVTPLGVQLFDDAIFNQLTSVYFSGPFVVKLANNSYLMIYAKQDGSDYFLYKRTATYSVVAEISPSPSSYNFGSIFVGNSSDAQTFTITNTGTTDLVIGTITITGANPTQFSKQNDNCSGQTIPPSESLTVQAIFSPTSTGVKNANLSIPSNVPGSPTLIPLTGTGTSAPSVFKARITIPTGTVNSDLTDFPVMLRLSDMPANFWNNVRSDGGDIRVKTTGDVQVPQDLVLFDFANQDGTVFFKDDVASGSDNEWFIYCGDPDLEKLPDDDANGRNAVWSDYHRVLFFGGLEGLVDHTGNTTYPVSYGAIYALPTTALAGDILCHQGISWDGTYYYTVDTNRIRKFDSSWQLVTENTDPIGDTGISGVDHCGDPECYNNKLYIPIEKYPNSPYNNQHIAVFNASDLTFIESFDISAQGFEVSSCCYNSNDGLFYVVSFVDGSKIWKYDPSNSFSYEGYISLSASLVLSQGITYWKGKFWINEDGGNTKLVESDGTVGPCIAYDPGSGTSWEGISHTDDSLIGISSSGTGHGIPYRLDQLNFEAETGFHVSGDNSYLTITATRYTTWTIGISAKLTSKGQNRCAASYSYLGSTGLTDRCGVAFRSSSDRFGLWNNTDGWLLSANAPSLDTKYRFHAIHNGTTERILYTDGVVATDSGCTAMPPAAANGFYIGIENETKAEDMNGDLGFFYLRPSILSSDWINAEVDNLNDPGNFYSVEEE